MNNKDIDAGSLPDNRYLALLRDGGFLFQCDHQEGTWSPDPPSSEVKRLPYIVEAPRDRSRDYLTSAAAELQRQNRQNNGRRGLVVIEGLRPGLLPALSDRFIDDKLRAEWTPESVWKKLPLGDTPEAMKWRNSLLHTITWHEQSQYEVVKVRRVSPKRDGKSIFPTKVWQEYEKTYFLFSSKHGLHGGENIVKVEHVHPDVDGLHCVDVKVDPHTIYISGIPYVSERDPILSPETNAMSPSIVTIVYSVDITKTLYHIYKTSGAHGREANRDREAVTDWGSTWRVDSDAWTSSWQQMPPEPTIAHETHGANQDSGAPSCRVVTGHKSKHGNDVENSHRYVSPSTINGTDSVPDVIQKNSACRAENMRDSWPRPWKTPSAQVPAGANINAQNGGQQDFSLSQACESVSGQCYSAGAQMEHWTVAECPVLSTKLTHFQVGEVGKLLMDRYGSEKMVAIVLQHLSQGAIQRLLSNARVATISTQSHQAQGAKDSASKRVKFGTRQDARMEHTSKYYGIARRLMMTGGNWLLQIGHYNRPYLLLELSKRYFEKCPMEKMAVLVQSSHMGETFLSHYEKSPLCAMGKKMKFFSSSSNKKLNSSNWGVAQRSVSVMIMSPQLLLNNITGTPSSFGGFGLVVLDECQHTLGGSSSSLLMRHYSCMPPSEQAKTQVIGMGPPNLEDQQEFFDALCYNLAIQRSNILNCEDSRRGQARKPHHR